MFATARTPVQDSNTNTNHINYNRVGDVNRSAPFGTFETPVLTTKLIGGKLTTVYETRRPPSPPRLQQPPIIPPNQNQRLNTYTVLPAIGNRTEYQPQPFNNQVTGNSDTIRGPLVLSKAQQAVLKRSIKADIHAMDLQRLKDLYTQFADRDANLSGFVHRSDLVGVLSASKFEMRAENIQLLAAMFASSTNSGQVNYEKVLSFISAAMKEGDYASEDGLTERPPAADVQQCQYNTSYAPISAANEIIPQPPPPPITYHPESEFFTRDQPQQSAAILPPYGIDLQSSQRDRLPPPPPPPLQPPFAASYNPYDSYNTAQDEQPSHRDPLHPQQSPWPSRQQLETSERDLQRVDDELNRLQREYERLRGEREQVSQLKKDLTPWHAASYPPPLPSQGLSEPQEPWNSLLSNETVNPASKAAAAWWTGKGLNSQPATARGGGEANVHPAGIVSLDPLRRVAGYTPRVDPTPWTERFSKLVTAMYTSDVKRNGYIPTAEARWLIGAYNRTYDLGILDSRVDQTTKDLSVKGYVPIRALLNSIVDTHSTAAA